MFSHPDFEDAAVSPGQPGSPRRIGTNDVERLRTATSRLRAIDYEHGGGACREATLAQLPFANALLSASATEHVNEELAAAVADLYNLAGWICFDLGVPESAHAHFRQALRLAGRQHDRELAANVHYRIGRVHLHYGAPDAALIEFERGQELVAGSGSRHASAILYANQAWAYAAMGRAGKAVAMLGRSHDDFDRREAARAPGWAAFFTETDLAAMTGTVQTELAMTADRRYSRPAIVTLSTVVAAYSREMSRSKTFMLTALATNHLLEGDLDQGVETGSAAVRLCASVASVRTIQRMRPLHREAARRSGNRDADRLRRQIAALGTA